MSCDNIDIVLDALTIMRRLFRACPWDANGKAIFHGQSEAIKAIILESIAHNNIRVNVQGLRVMGSFINTLADSKGAILPQFAGLCMPFYTAINSKLQSTELPQDIK